MARYAEFTRGNSDQKVYINPDFVALIRPHGDDQTELILGIIGGETSAAREIVKGTPADVRRELTGGPDR